VTSENQMIEWEWQPVRIAPVKEILKVHSETRYGEFSGQIVRVRPYCGPVRTGTEFEFIRIAKPFCGARSIFLVHPEDALRITNGETNNLVLCEHQIQAD
jgi:hypothetical protein